MEKTAEEIQEEIETLQARITELRKQLPHQPRKLSEAFIRDVKHSGRAGPDRHTAGSGGYGLALVVKQSGAKTFIQRLTLDGKRTDIGLGPYPQVSLQEAREAAFENRKLVRAGMGLADLIRPGASPRRATGVPTLAEAAAEVIETQSQSWRKGSRTRDAWEANLRRYAFPALGELPVDRIGTRELLQVVEPFWATKHRAMSDLLNRLSSIFKWAMAQQYRNDDPTPAVRKALPRNGKQRGHFAALPHSQVGEALAAIRKDDKRPAASLALQFVLLTACRSGEACGAKWSEIDREAKTWTVPAERMKAGVEHVVPLSGQALAILEEAKALGGERLVFPAPRGGELWGSALAMVLRGAGFETAQVHGFRSSFRDWCAENDVDRHLAEAALAHTVRGVEGAYLRTKRIEERRTLMQRWADYLDSNNKGETR